jgi:hypothetical protein
VELRASVGLDGTVRAVGACVDRPYLWLIWPCGYVHRILGAHPGTSNQNRTRISKSKVMLVVAWLLNTRYFPPTRIPYSLGWRFDHTCARPPSRFDHPDHLVTWRWYLRLPHCPLPSRLGVGSTLWPCERKTIGQTRCVGNWCPSTIRPPITDWAMQSGVAM